MTQLRSFYRFHDVSVVLIGNADLVSRFGGALSIEGDFSTPPTGETTIQLRLLGDPVGRATTAELSVREEPAHVIVEEAGVEARVDLTTCQVEVRGCAGVPFHPSQTRVIVGALLLALRELGVVRLHAAAVVHADRALVLVGDSGAGKTTTALALIQAGCAPLTDDQLFVRERGDEWELLCAPQAFRVTERTLGAFASLEYSRGALLPELGKYELAVHHAFADSQLDRFRGPVQLLFPRRAAPLAGIRLVPMHASEAVGELMVASPAVAIGDRERVRAHAALLQRLSDASRPLWLDLGPELLEHPERAGRSILSSLERAAT